MRLALRLPAGHPVNLNLPVPPASSSSQLPPPVSHETLIESLLRNAATELPASLLLPAFAFANYWTRINQAHRSEEEEAQLHLERMNRTAALQAAMRRRTTMRTTAVNQSRPDDLSPRGTPTPGLGSEAEPASTESASTAGRSPTQDPTPSSPSPSVADTNPDEWSEWGDSE